MKEKVSIFLPYEAPDGADFFREKYTYVCIINLLLSYIVCISYIYIKSHPIIQRLYLVYP